jgi:beta-apo-4'-carotenal oxygenase
MGSYHGVYSFRSFSHYRTIAKVPGWFDKLLRVRYMPYSSKELARFQAMSSKKVNFDREGNVNRGLAYWLSFLFTLGGSGAKSTLFRWGILLAVAMTLRLKRTTLGL